MARAVKSVQRTAELARRRERRRRRTVILLAVGLLGVVGIYAGYTYWLRDSPLVEIRHLEVRGVTTDSEEGKQIKSAVEVAAGEMTTLHLQPEVLDQELSRFPRVASSSITASFPNSATVTVGLRGDGSVFGSGSDALLIATDGTVLGTAGEGTDSLPKIGTGDPPTGDRVEGRTLTQALVLGAVPTELRSYVVQSDFRKGGVEVTLSNGLVLLFGDATQTDQKWRAAASVISDPELFDASYVDLTVPRRPAVKGPETTIPEEEVVPEAPLEAPPTG